MAKRNKKKNPKFFTFIYLLLLIISSIFLYVIYSLNMLPLRYYLLIVCAFVIILSFFGLILLNKRIRKPLKVIFTLFAIILNIGMALVSNYTFNAQDVMNKITKKVNYKTENYSLVILSSGNYEEVADLESKDIGYLDNGTKGTKKALETLGGMVKLANDDYDDVQKLANDLLKEKINAILVEDSFKEILEEETEDFKDATEVLYSFSVKIPEEKSSKKVDVTSSPFNVYLTGIDTYGKITSVSRSDVNIIASVNPKTGKVLLTSIPRDYYVDLYGKDAKDKLTHAGIYGVETSIKTIENLLDLKINYYVKVNFTSVEKIVDTLGGITVHSDYAFTSYLDHYHYNKGDNYLNGKKALSFARERHAFGEGDIQRGKDQMYVIKAIADKLMSISSLTKFNDLLDTLDGTFETNITSDEIASLVKMQLDKKINWQIENNYLNGEGESKVTYTTKSKAYVMVPDITTVASAKTKISKIFNEEA